jgi:signal transduction histidine kinase
MLETIAANLIDNALRYAGTGATFTLRAAPEDGDVVLSGSDTGPGVLEEDLPRLFERFFRSDRARSSHGTGLGLAIVKHIVTSAGGAAEARHAPGGGLEIRCVFQPSSL